MHKYMFPLPCTEGPLNQQGDGRDAFNGKTSHVAALNVHYRTI